MLALLLAYAPAAILMAYCISFLFNDAQSAQSLRAHTHTHTRVLSVARVQNGFRKRSTC